MALLVPFIIRFLQARKCSNKFTFLCFDFAQTQRGLIGANAFTRTFDRDERLADFCVFVIARCLQFGESVIAHAAFARDGLYKTHRGGLTLFRYFIHASNHSSAPILYIHLPYIHTCHICLCTKR